MRMEEEKARKASTALITSDQTERRNISGTFTSINFDKNEFEAQRRHFLKYGHVQHPEDPNVIVGVVDEDKILDQKEVKRRKKKSGSWNEDPVEPAGPTPEERARYLNEQAEATRIKVTAFSDKQDDVYSMVPGEEKTFYHLSEEKPFIEPSPVWQDISASLTCFAPSREMHTYIGHTKGVTALRFFPLSGHLLLTASQDGRARLWDVEGDRQCIRSYLGHSKPIKDIQFGTDGHTFLTLSYDRYLKVWDTETGKKLSHYLYRPAVMFTAMYPRENIVMAGTNDRKILEWDTRQPGSRPVMSYEGHMGPVTRIIKVDDRFQFVSACEDTSMAIWEHGISSPRKIFQEPEMPAATAMAINPRVPALAAQTHDLGIHAFRIGRQSDDPSFNGLLSSTSGDNLLLTRQVERHFEGHQTLGYGCGIGFSPDGRFISSGDALGGVHIWEWHGGSKMRYLEKAHTGPVMDVAWHPQERSVMATCSLDCSIKLWK